MANFACMESPCTLIFFCVSGGSKRLTTVNALSNMAGALTTTMRAMV